MQPTRIAILALFLAFHAAQGLEPKTKSKDLLSEVLSGLKMRSIGPAVTSGRVVNTVRIDGAPYDNSFFSQPPGIELELWLSKNEQALPRRLIVTYRSLPGQPNFIAEFSDWNFENRPSDAEFVFQPPAGATKVDVAKIGTLSGNAGGNK